MQDLKDQTIIITGTSSGIGEATALNLASAGMRVMCAARREGRLKDLCARIKAAGGVAEYRIVDVASLAEMKQLAADTIEAFGQIDAIFNNAGLMPVSFLANLHTDEWERMVDVNIKGVLWGIAACLPHMLERGRGHIINNASIAGHVISPAYAVYSATKSAVLVISEGLRQETGDKIRTTVISPGITKTELTDHITDQDVLDKLMKGRFDYIVHSEDIARGVRYALEQPWHVDVNEVIIRATGQGR